MITDDPYGKLDLDDDEKDRSTDYNSFGEMKIRIPFLCLISGPRGSHKTSTVINLIKSLKCFDRFYFCVKDMNEILYQNLFNRISEIETALKRKIMYIIKNISEIQTIKFNKRYNSILLFDDQINCSKEEWSVISNLCLVHARHNNVSVAFLTQSLVDVPIKIRKNVDLGIIKSINNQREIKMIINNWNNTDIDNKLLYKIYQKASVNCMNSIMFNLNPSTPEKFRLTINGVPVLKWYKKYKEDEEDG
jgi:hypothetical protein